VLAFPFVLLAVFMAGEAGSDWVGEWLVADVLYAIAGGLAIGAAVGVAAAWSVKRLRDRELLAPALDSYHAIATVLVIYGLAEVAGTYGFLAAFAGGLAFRRYEHDHEVNGNVHEGAELTEKLLELSVILLLGSLLTRAGLGVPGWEGWLLAALVIVVVRPLACVVALLGSQLDRPTEKTFVAWFGVRGVGSLFYAATAVEAGVLARGEEQLLMWTVIACVLLSIVVHGITAGPSLRRILAPHRRAAART
jgi:sodium/hydrogen antiporter